MCDALDVLEWESLVREKVSCDALPSVHVCRQGFPEVERQKQTHCVSPGCWVYSLRTASSRAVHSLSSYEVVGGTLPHLAKELSDSLEPLDLDLFHADLDQVSLV